MDSIPRIRRVLIGRLESLVFIWAAALGIGVGSLRDWVDGIVGEGIAQAISQHDKWNPAKGDFLHWAFLKCKRLLRKELKNETRYRRAIQRLRELAPGAGHPRTVDALRDDLLDTLEQLSFLQQQALALYYLNGMTTEMLGEYLGKSPEAVQAILSRARTKARQVIKTPLLPLEGDTRSGSAQPERKPPFRLPQEAMSKKAELEDIVNRLFRLTDDTSANP